MNSNETIYILGAGAIGFPLAAYLTHAGRNVVAVRTSTNDVLKSTINVTVQQDAQHIQASVQTISLSNLNQLDGTIVVAAKSYANSTIAQALKEKRATGALVVMQNGVGVETPFLDAQFPVIYRCVLYATSQPTSPYDFTFRPVSASPIGSITGDEARLSACVKDLTTDSFPFRVEANIQREIWKKAIINAVFNSVCPLLDVDNGIFVRDQAAVDLAQELISECIALTDKIGIGLSEQEVLQQLLVISKRSDGQYISTLQDIRNGRPTEIASLNLEIARVAAALEPSLYLPKIEFLGKMIVAKSSQQRNEAL